MKEYKISFFHKEVKVDQKGKKTGEESVKFLGFVQVDDTGTSNELPLECKAFRQCDAKCLNANVLRIERV